MLLWLSYLKQLELACAGTPPGGAADAKTMCLAFRNIHSSVSQMCNNLWLRRTSPEKGLCSRQPTDHNKTITYGNALESLSEFLPNQPPSRRRYDENDARPSEWGLGRAPPDLADKSVTEGPGRGRGGFAPYRRRDFTFIIKRALISGPPDALIRRCTFLAGSPRFPCGGHRKVLDAMDTKITVNN
ncbi:unnamed protein product, partial [Iphiclides podalirius]